MATVPVPQTAGLADGRSDTTSSCTIATPSDSSLITSSGSRPQLQLRTKLFRVSRNTDRLDGIKQTLAGVRNKHPTKGHPLFQTPKVVHKTLVGTLAFWTITQSASSAGVPGRDQVQRPPQVTEVPSWAAGPRPPLGSYELLEWFAIANAW